MGFIGATFIPRTVDPQKNPQQKLMEREFDVPDKVLFGLDKVIFVALVALTTLTLLALHGVNLGALTVIASLGSTAAYVTGGAALLLLFTNVVILIARQSAIKSRLERQLADLEYNKQTKDTELQEAKKRVQNLQDELQNAEDNVQHKSSEQEELLKQQITKITRERDDGVKAQQTQQKLLTEKNAELEKLKKQLDTSHALHKKQLEISQALHNEALAKAQQIKLELGQAQENLKHVQAENALLLKKAPPDQAGNLKKIGELQATITKLEQTLLGAQQDLKAQTLELGKANKEKKDLINKDAEMTARNSQLEKDMAIFKKAEGQREDELNEYIAKIQKLEEVVKKLTQELTKLSKTGSVDATQSIIDGLKDKLAQLQKQYDDFARLSEAHVKELTLLKVAHNTKLAELEQTKEHATKAIEAANKNGEEQYNRLQQEHKTMMAEQKKAYEKAFNEMAALSANTAKENDKLYHEKQALQKTVAELEKTNADLQESVKRYKEHYTKSPPPSSAPPSLPPTSTDSKTSTVPPGAKAEKPAPTGRPLPIPTKPTNPPPSSSSSSSNSSKASTADTKTPPKPPELPPKNNNDQKDTSSGGSLTASLLTRKVKDLKKNELKVDAVPKLAEHVKKMLRERLSGAGSSITSTMGVAQARSAVSLALEGFKTYLEKKAEQFDEETKRQIAELQQSIVMQEEELVPPQDLAFSFRADVKETADDRYEQIPKEVHAYFEVLYTYIAKGAPEDKLKRIQACNESLAVELEAMLDEIKQNRSKDVEKGNEQRALKDLKDQNEAKYKATSVFTFGTEKYDLSIYNFNFACLLGVKNSIRADAAFKAIIAAKLTEATTAKLQDLASKIRERRGRIENAKDEQTKSAELPELETMCMSMKKHLDAILRVKESFMMLGEKFSFKPADFFELIKN